MSYSDISKGVCPACGRFVGHADFCEYCDVDMPGRELIRTCRIWAWLAIALSLALLWYATELRQVPEVRAEDIKPSMNHALVRLEGRVASVPYVRVSEAGNEYASFLLSDGVKAVRICLKGQDAVCFAQVTAEGVKGRRLTAVGVLQVRAKEEPRLFVRSVGGLPSWKLTM